MSTVRHLGVWPDAGGHFGPYGGRFVPETLMEPLRELEAAYGEARKDPAFRSELAALLRDYVGRPTPLGRATRLSERLGCRVYLKREDLCHTGAHKINNAVGQALLARRMGKPRIIAETGAGQHGVASATAAALPYTYRPFSYSPTSCRARARFWRRSGPRRHPSARAQLAWRRSDKRYRGGARGGR